MRTASADSSARMGHGVFDNEALTFVNEVDQRADAFLFGRWTHELFAGYWGVREDLENPIVVGQGTGLFPDAGPDIALDLVDSRAFPKGTTLQVYRPTGRPQYAM